MSRVEPAVQGTVVHIARVHSGSPPRAARRAEAQVVGDVVGEQALRDQPRRPARQIRPVPPAPKKRTMHGVEFEFLELDITRLQMR